MKESLIKMKRNIIIICLAVLLIVSAGYILIDRSSDACNKEKEELLQQSLQYGYNKAISDLANAVATCNVQTLVVGNQSLEIVAVGCLSQEWLE